MLINKREKQKRRTVRFSIYEFTNTASEYDVKRKFISLKKLYFTT